MALLEGGRDLAGDGRNLRWLAALMPIAKRAVAREELLGRRERDHT